MKYVIALGGNALEGGKEAATAENQLKAVQLAVRGIADVIEAGHTVVITHGNGPQVGRILIQNEYAAKQSPAMPFDVCGAMSQGMIGYHIQQALGQELRRRKIEKSVVSVITQVVVEQQDAAFSNPTKPIGAFYNKMEGDRLSQEYGYVMKEDAGRGYRRVVASPMPKEIVELKAIEGLIDLEHVVIACGGGGVPVVQDADGLHGVAAVIDKDLASALLAKELDADGLIILTAVEQVAINFGKENQENLSSISIEQAQAYKERGEFGVGSMLPKVEAAMMFAQSGGGGRVAVITALEKVASAIGGQAGTRIHW